MRAQLADVNALGEAESEDEATNKHLTFNLSDEVFALPVGRVSEIVGIQQITPVPLTDSYVRGVMNLRGQVVPVVDLRERCGLALRAYDARTCVIVVEHELGQVGLVADSVRDVLDVEPTSIQRGAADRVAARFVSGFVHSETGVLMVMELGALLDRTLSIDAASVTPTLDQVQ